MTPFNELPSFNSIHELTRKGTQMINSDLIQTLVIDRPNFRMNNQEKNFWRRFTLATYRSCKKPNFLTFLKYFNLKMVYG